MLVRGVLPLPLCYGYRTEAEMVMSKNIWQNLLKSSHPIPHIHNSYISSYISFEIGGSYIIKAGAKLSSARMSTDYYKRLPGKLWPT